MANMDEKRESFLRTEYEQIGKAYEISFNHFMQVFYFWIGVVGLPTTAGALFKSVSITGIESTRVFAVICVGAGLLGLFIAAKMFDIRGSQLRYVHHIKEIRSYFWGKYEIKRLNIVPLNNDKGLRQTARTDFGIWMAGVMSFVNGFLVAIGYYVSLSGATLLPRSAASVLLLLSLAVFNFCLYFQLVVNKIPGTTK